MLPMHYVRWRAFRLLLANSGECFIVLKGGRGEKSHSNHENMEKLLVLLKLMHFQLRLQSAENFFNFWALGFMHLKLSGIGWVMKGVKSISLRWKVFQLKFWWKLSGWLSILIVPSSEFWTLFESAVNRQKLCRSVVRPSSFNHSSSTIPGKVREFYCLFSRTVENRGTQLHDENYSRKFLSGDSTKNKNCSLNKIKLNTSRSSPRYTM